MISYIRGSCKFVRSFTGTLLKVSDTKGMVPGGFEWAIKPVVVNTYLICA